MSYISILPRRSSQSVNNEIARFFLRRPQNWETRFGCWAAMSLTVLEVKRLLLLTLEMLVNSRAIRFAGALMPIIFAFVDVGLGFPAAVAAVYAIRKHKVRPCQPKIKRALRRVLLSLTVCSILNVATVALIGLYVNGNASLIEKMFRASMKAYAKNAYYKVSIDELQLDLQCCGFSSYSDWFAIDWQLDYDDSDEGEPVNEQSVPFSCCNRRAMMPCIHMEMGASDERTVNARGCADIISRILFKIALVGYTMTGLIVSTQILMIVFFVRIIQRVLPEICPSDCSCWESTCQLKAPIINYSSDDCTSASPEKHVPEKRQSRNVVKWKTSSRCFSSSDSDSETSSCERLTSSPSFSELADRRVGLASIEPSAQQQHRLPAPAQCRNNSKAKNARKRRRKNSMTKRQ
ncbi:hypothetical protein TSAR_007865 [Trichomalopsis sarcophagae]|uniref:Tetraspanin n=1 Tax=Trichomalopsis sarcophagae TaxID=543379 RepID=A0A232FGW0_9HYME|nr:hypothetical protein TSAR_007865 [Trichomalopsis sarcophagae]